MALLTNPNFAYVLVILGVTLIFLAIINSKKTMRHIGIALCVIATVLGFLYLRINPWAFIVVAFSPVIFWYAVRQARPQSPLFIISIFMLTLASFYLFVDMENQPVVSLRLVFLAVLSASVIWISAERLRNVEGARVGNDPDSVVGLIGETISDIEAYSAGSVLVDGEVWQARSKEPIPSGSMVRVLRQDGFWLTVKKTENLTKK